MSKIFISYSHKDEEWKDKLVEHLKVLELEGYCSSWDDRKIEIGDNWFPEIEKALNEAQIVIMMISTHFLTSDFIRREEVPRILERRRKEGLRVIPIIVKPCAWETVHWLAAVQLVPKDGKPLSTLKDHEIDEELASLVKRIAALIKTKKKPDEEIVKAVEEYDGHALALTLLGQYIKSVFAGDIRKRDRIPKLTLERRQGRHARQVMEAYARWLGESPERDILYIMGLFDRPFEMGAIEALNAEPPIPGVTEQLQQLNEEDWGYALDNLRGANLLAKEDPGSDTPGVGRRRI